MSLRNDLWKFFKKPSSKNPTKNFITIKKIIANPEIGVEKVGDLKGIFVHKFKVFDQQFLLAYSFDEVTMTLIMLGVHENFYRSVKNILK